MKVLQTVLPVRSTESRFAVECLAIIQVGHSFHALRDQSLAHINQTIDRARLGQTSVVNDKLDSQVQIASQQGADAGWPRETAFKCQSPAKEVSRIW